jgi:hypothetical protein
MESFAYHEEVRFTDLGVPALVYAQRAWSPDDGDLLHLETGLWRCDPEGALAVTIALPRVTEISEGTVRGGAIRLSSTSVSRAAGGAGLVAVRRSYDLRGDTLAYEIAMATERVGTRTRHLVGELLRVD